MSETPVVLVTGANSGIGRAVTENLYRRGYVVVATARHLQTLADVECSERLSLDVANEESVQTAAAAVGGIDVLINNAGVGAGGPAEHLPIEETQRLMDVNFLGTVRCIAAFLPPMRQRGSGMIVNISSMSARIPWLFASSYAASKAALGAYSEALRWEVAPFGVKVVIIEPGKIATEFGSRFRLFGEDDDGYQPASRVWGRQFEAAAPGPELVASAVAEVVIAKDPPSRLVVGQDAIDLLGFRKQLDDAEFDDHFARYFALQPVGCRPRNDLP